jgi:glycosyltransferase involved in cell wall biosynthesis
MVQIKQNLPKVLFIGPYPPPFSGPELGMKMFLESTLLQDNFDITFVQTNHRSSNKNKGKLDLSMIGAFFSYFWRLFLALWRVSPQIVYYPVTATQVGWVGRDVWTILLASMFGSKVIIHLRGSHLKLNFDGFNFIVKRLIKWACHKVSMALVQANCLMDQFDYLVERNKIRVLYNAIDLEEFKTASTINMSKRPTVLFFGHMTQAKGYIDLMRSLPVVVEQIPDVLYQVCGTLRKGERGVFFDQTSGEPLTYEDPYEIHHDTLKGPLQAHYDYRGIVTGDEKIRLLKEAHIFALPSYSEGMSRSVLEAMACGKPVVVTPVGSHSEIINNNEQGLIVPTGDINKIADALIELLRNTTRIKQIGNRNTEYVNQEFSVSVISKKLCKYFQEVLP